MIDDPDVGLPLLTGMLAGAREFLAVLDPYFGHQEIDWTVLKDVTVPVHVLTQHGKWNEAKAEVKGGPQRWQLNQKVKAPPPGTAARAPDLQVRTWRGHEEQRSAPWHDRVYLWQGGGLSVGTSPSGLGKRVARVDRLSGAEAAGWQALFDRWWASPDVQQLEP